MPIGAGGIPLPHFRFLIALDVIQLSSYPVIQQKVVGAQMASLYRHLEPYTTLIKPDQAYTTLK